MLDLVSIQRRTWLLLLKVRNTSTKILFIICFADPYSDMILVDGITLLCNDLQVGF